jgi:hypothetical protein
MEMNFDGCSAFLRIAAEDDHTKKMRRLIIAMVDQNGGKITFYTI